METCDPLETWVGEVAGEPVVLSCWQMSAAELEEVNRNGGRVWVRMVTNLPVPPISVDIEDPWK